MLDDFLSGCWAQGTRPEFNGPHYAPLWSDFYCKERGSTCAAVLAVALGSDRCSYLALNELDRKRRKHLDHDGGTFIEAGANDGLRQSNTY